MYLSVRLALAFAAFAAVAVNGGFAQAEVAPIKPCVVADNDPALAGHASLRALQQARGMPHILRCDNEDPREPPIFFIASAARKSSAAVCGYHTVQVVADRTAGKPAWSDIAAARATKLWEAGTSACPKLGDPRYIHTRGVPDDVFVLLTAFWRDLTSSPKRFDALVPRKMRGARALRADLFGASGPSENSRLSSITAKTTDIASGPCKTRLCYKFGVGAGRFLGVAVGDGSAIRVVDITTVLY
jgi:hypothetical protein